MKHLTIAVDLDGTLCAEKKAFEKIYAEPFIKAIEAVNDLYNKGNTIIIFTARGWNEYRITKDWLSSNNVLYNELIMGKPNYDYIIDDRSFQSVQNFIEAK